MVTLLYSTLLYSTLLCSALLYAAPLPLDFISIQRQIIPTGFDRLFSTGIYL